MAQLHDKHLTIEQLSAFFDQQLSPQEQAGFEAHLSTCQHCQRNLADLRLTIALLHTIPEEEAPRSFVLPGNLSFVPERAVQQIPATQKRRVRFNTLRRSIRVVSTLAAVLALLFIMSGILPPLHFGGASSATNTTSSGTSGEANTAHSTVITPGNQEATNARLQEGAVTTTPTPVPTQTLTPNGTATTKTGPGTQSNQGPGVPPVLDPGQPVGRLSLGVLLLALSIVGLIITRRRRLAVNE